MSRILRRPMFRKGGSVEKGIGSMMPRKKYATGSEYAERLIKAAGESSDYDPLTKFLLSYGPALASQKPTGGLLGTLTAAAAKPTEQLLIDRAKKAEEIRNLKIFGEKVAIEQEGQERLKLLDLQNQKIDAEKKARVILGPDASSEEVRKKASQILEQDIFGVGQRFEKGQKQGEVEIIAKQSKVDLPTARILHNLQQNPEKIKAATGLELGPNNGIIYGQKIKGNLDYSNEARNLPDGIYYDPLYRTYVKIQSGVSKVIPNPLTTESAPVSSIPDTGESKQTASSNRSFDFLSPDQKSKLEQIKKSSPEDFGLTTG